MNEECRSIKNVNNRFGYIVVILRSFDTTENISRRTSDEIIFHSVCSATPDKFTVDESDVKLTSFSLPIQGPKIIEQFCLSKGQKLKSELQWAVYEQGSMQVTFPALSIKQLVS